MKNLLYHIMHEKLPDIILSISSWNIVNVTSVTDVTPMLLTSILLWLATLMLVLVVHVSF